MKKLIFFIILFGSGKAFAQKEGTFYFMNTVSQSTYYNPAFISKYNTSIGLPLISSNYLEYHNSGFALKDLVNASEEALTVSEYYKLLKDENNFKVRANFDLFHLSFKLNPRMHMTVNVTDKNDIHFLYPKEIVNLFTDGNSPILTQNTNFSLAMNGNGYVETGLGLNYKINPFWTVGTRFKMLKGYANATTEEADFTINTADNNQIEFRGSAIMRASGVNELFDEDNDFASYKGMINNNGFGFDLGVSFKPMDKLLLGFSMVDIGKIKWTNNLKSYILEPFAQTLDGIDIEQLLDKDSDYEWDIDELGIEFEESEGAAYKASLPSKFYLSGSYELARNLYTNLLIGGEKRKGSDLDMYTTANITKNVGKAMTVGLSYTMAQNSYNNLGAGISFNLAPFQLYFVGDSVLGASGLVKNDLNKSNINYFNFRFGLNFIGAWEKTTEKLSDDKIF